MVQQVDEALFELAAKADRPGEGGKRFAAPIDLVEPGYEALRRQFRQHRAHRIADKIAVAGKGEVGVVDVLVDVIGAGQDGHEARHLLQGIAVAVGLAPARVLGLHLAGDFETLVEESGDKAVFADDRRCRESPPGRFLLAVTQHRQFDVFLEKTLPRLERAVKGRAHLLPGAAPDLRHRARQRPRMAIGHGFDVGIVIEHAQVRPPQHGAEHG